MRLVKSLRYPALVSTPPSARPRRIRIARAVSVEELADKLAALGQLERERLGVDEARLAIAYFPPFFKRLVVAGGYSEAQAQAFTTKLRDAGRRSPPWRPASGRVPGRPQDGADGNRRNRWLFEEEHKFYADELTATLVEVRYFLQALSMDGAPSIDGNPLRDEWAWLAGHPIEPGQYKDPIQLIPISFPEVIQDLRQIESGHLIPLNRDGRHTPDNAFLMLARSNDLQGDLTLDEMLGLMRAIVERHQQESPAEPEVQL